MTTRSDLLNEAEQCVTGQRADDYGSLENNFKIIAEYWSRHLTATNETLVLIEGHDVAIMMALLKLARLASNPRHHDSWVDVAGYAACGAELVPALADISIDADARMVGV